VFRREEAGWWRQQAGSRDSIVLAALGCTLSWTISTTGLALEHRRVYSPDVSRVRRSVPTPTAPVDGGCAPGRPGAQRA
jgi:hypothetical protein